MKKRGFILPITLAILILGIITIFFMLGHKKAHGQTVPGLEQWVASSSPSSNITQRVYGRSVKLTGLTTGQCLTLDSNGIVTTVACGSGGVGTSTNPFMASYFVATSTTATSTFANGLNITAGCYSLNGTCLSSGGTPGGSNTQFQFNDSGAFGGATTTIFDKISGFFGTAINNTSSVTLTHPFQVGGGNTYSSPTSIAGVISYYTPPSPPATGSASANYGIVLSDPTNFTATQNDGETGYTADGTNNQTYYIAGYKTVGGVKYYSGGSASYAFTDNSDMSTFGVDLSWTASANVDGYYIYSFGGVRGTSAYYFIDVGNVTSYADQNTSWAITGNFAPTPNHLTYLASGQTINYRVYDYTQPIGGINLYSTTYKQIDFTDDHRSQHPPASGSSVINTAGGTYQSNGYTHQYEVWSVYPDGGYSSTSFNTQVTDPGNYTVGNVSGASAVINYAGSGYTANSYSYTYDIYAFFNSPGGTVYSAAGSQTSDMDDGSTNPYENDISWGAVTGADGYIIFISGGPHGYAFDYSTVISGGATTSYVDNDTGWSLNTTTYAPTPTSISYNYQVGLSWGAVTGASDYLVLKAGGDSGWSYNYYYLTGGSTSFNDTDDSIWTAYAGTTPPTPTEADTYYNLSVNWGSVGGITDYRLLRQVAGGGYTGYHDQATNSLTDTSGFSWLGSPTVTNTLYHATGATHSIKAYSYNNIDAIYSSTHADNSVTDNNSGNYYSVAWTASNYPASVDKLKFIIDSTNGELLTNPTLAYTDINQSYNSNTTVTPNGSVLPLFYADRFGNVNAGTLTASSYVDALKYGTGVGRVQIGVGAAATQVNSIAIGDSTTASSASVAVGYIAVATGNSSAAYGIDVHATGAGSVAIGSSASASFSDSTAIGDTAYATNGGLALGTFSTASQTASVALGNSATASNSNAAALGVSSLSSGVSSIAVGASAHAQADRAVALGNQTTANVADTIAIGTNTTATNNRSIAIGYAAGAGGADALAFGESASASSGYGIAIGYAASVSSGIANTAIGFGATANASNGDAVAIGASAQATGDFATAVGYSVRNSFANSAMLGASVTGVNNLLVLSTGKASIGTSTPFGIFQIASSTSSSTFKPQLILTDTSAATSSKHWFLSSDKGTFNIGTTSDTYATTTYLTINTTGRVGIGTTSPTELFQAQGPSSGSATKGTCFRAKDVGATTFTYWWYKAGVQTIQTTSCSGSGTTTITYD